MNVVYPASFCNKKFANNILKLFFIFYLIVIFSFLFLQNFVLTENFELFTLRSLDGFNFHVELRKLHDYLAHGEIKKILKESFFFGYGFIFWISFALITFPFYLFDAEQLIIITTLEICLIFQMLCLWVLYKISSIYSKSELTKISICFLGSLFGIFGFFGLHFYAITPVAFFELLALYCTIRIKTSPTKKDLIIIALLAAVAVGIKVTGILIMPAICLILADRCKWVINKENQKNFFIFILVFFTGTIILSHPYFSNYSSYLETINSFRNYTSSNGGTIINDNLLFMFNKGVVGNFLPGIALLSLLIIFVVRIFLDLKLETSRRRDFLYILLNCLMALVYCLISVKRDPIILANYLLAFAFLFLLSLTVKDYWKYCTNLQKLIITGSISTILISTAFYRFNIGINKNDLDLRNPRYIYNLENNESKNKIDAMLQIKKITQEYRKNNEEISIIYDYQILLPYSRIRQGIIAINYLDNINITQNWYEKEFDFIILGKKSIIMKASDDIIKEQTANVTKERLEDFLASHKIVEKLLKHGEFKKSKYRLLYDGQDMLIFKKIN
jgi:hypothetical protein